jgi:hypothetical protein
MAHARTFWISKLQDLFNDTKNTWMQGDLTPAIELWFFGSPGGLQLPTLLGVWASPSHLAQSGGATSMSISSWVYSSSYCIMLNIDVTTLAGSNAIGCKSIKNFLVILVLFHPLILATLLWESVRMRLTLLKWGLRSRSGLSKLQNSMIGVKTPWIVLVGCRFKWVIRSLSLFLVPSQSFSTPLYPF